MAALWAEYACTGNAPAKPELVEVSLESAIVEHLEAAARPTPPMPPRMFKVSDGDALEVIEQFDYAIQALAARGTPPSEIRVSFEPGGAWVIG